MLLPAPGNTLSDAEHTTSEMAAWGVGKLDAAEMSLNAALIYEPAGGEFAWVAGASSSFTHRRADENDSKRRHEVTPLICADRRVRGDEKRDRCPSGRQSSWGLIDHMAPGYRQRLRPPPVAIALPGRVSPISSSGLAIPISKPSPDRLTRTEAPITLVFAMHGPQAKQPAVVAAGRFDEDRGRVSRRTGTRDPSSSFRRPRPAGRGGSRGFRARERSPWWSGERCPRRRRQRRQRRTRPKRSQAGARRRE